MPYQSPRDQNTRNSKNELCSDYKIGNTNSRRVKVITCYFVSKLQIEWIWREIEFLTDLKLSAQYIKLVKEENS